MHVCMYVYTYIHYYNSLTPKSTIKSRSAVHFTLVSIILIFSKEMGAMLTKP